MRLSSLIGSTEELPLYDFRQPQIKRPCNLDVDRRALDHRHAMSDALDELTLIRSHEPIRVRALERFTNYRVSKSLRRLRVVNAPPVERALSSPRLHLLNGIGRRQCHQRGSCARCAF